MRPGEIQNKNKNKNKKGRVGKMHQANKSTTQCTIETIQQFYQDQIIKCTALHHTLVNLKIKIKNKKESIDSWYPIIYVCTVST